MRNKRKIVVRLIADNKVQNQRLAEFFAKAFNERNMNHDQI